MAELHLVHRGGPGAVVVAVASLLTSCTIGKGIADFSDHVTNQPPITFGESRQLVKGQYTSPIVDPWDDRGPVIIAFVYMDGYPHLAMRPEDGSQGCETGMAYSSVVRDKLSNRVQLVAYRGPSQKDKPGTEPLVFVDHYCNEYGQPIIGGSLPEVLYSDPPGYLAKVVDPANPVTQYWVVDPWNATTRVLASNASWYSLMDVTHQIVGVIDSGHLRIFDAHQQLVADVGTAMTEVLFASDWTGPLYTVDGGSVFKYKSTSDTAPAKIAEDACQVSQDGSSALFYFSPCSSRQLQHQRLETGQATTIDTNVTAIVSSRSKAGTTDVYVLYTKPAAQGGQDLWFYSPDAAPALVIPNFNRLYDWTPTPTLDVIAMVNADSDTGTVIHHDTSGDTPVLQSVSVKFSQGVLANFDTTASVGDLYYPLQLGSAPQFAASGVPFVDQVKSIVSPSPKDNPGLVQFGSAVITNATGGVGDLQLMRMPNPTSPGPEQPVTLASGFPIGRLDLFEGMTAIGYLENYDKELSEGHLAVQELTLGALTDISDEVKEFQEVKWPSEGIMYVIWNGDRAGIWQAKAK